MFLKVVDEVFKVKKVLKLEEFVSACVYDGSFDSQEDLDYSLNAENVFFLFESIIGFSCINYNKFKQIKIETTKHGNELGTFYYLPTSSRVFLLDDNDNNIDKF
ncbi:MAG: hypothetical protein ACRCX7_10010 [Cetobacterium sp.]|uniref:hypothetical protein n=1 Tax=Cetobacterium sp. TaxID=2071632 RepID=UPI003F376B46